MSKSIKSVSIKYVKPNSNEFQILSNGIKFRVIFTKKPGSKKTQWLKVLPLQWFLRFEGRAYEIAEFDSYKEALDEVVRAFGEQVVQVRSWIVAQ